ncbi:copper homeostasis protein CutC [Virgibacillus alimentarius]|uniref:Copper homeostasis protein CutC n=1 Tax=Virgibacillus alimentarius TaxID=698769 RepID=A0ABS4S9B1_9BACI|nr:MULTISPECIES: hypothetical protein [Virgibacillus]MBP2256987.1 copper homeostasis protein CutC [Virgibacillus alimentarius]HLR68027.1 hypothetical protein [Virgibacillus sp.]
MVNPDFLYGGGAGKEQLAKLVGLSRKLDGPIIMPGSGLTSNNIQDIHEATGACAYHFEKSVRLDRSFVNGFSQ